MTIKAFRENRGIGSQEQSFDWGWTGVGVNDHNVTNPWFTEFTWALRELGILWEGASDKSYSASKQKVSEELRKIIRLLIVKSTSYRRYLQHEMIQEEYYRTIEEFPTLGLTELKRKDATSDVAKVYWQLRTAPIIGRVVGKFFARTADHTNPYLGVEIVPRKSTDWGQKLNG